MEFYTKKMYPLFVANHGNWDIYCDLDGRCAAIPTAAAKAGGCRASHYGDLNHVSMTMGKPAAAAGRAAITRAVGNE